MPMILAANANAQGSHVGEWRHADAWDLPAANIANAVRLAQIAEAGKMDLLFLADGNGVRNMEKPDLFAATSPSDRPGVFFEPVTLPVRTRDGDAPYWSRRNDHHDLR